MSQDPGFDLAAIRGAYSVDDGWSLPRKQVLAMADEIDRLWVEVARLAEHSVILNHISRRTAIALGRVVRDEDKGTMENARALNELLIVEHDHYRATLNAHLYRNGQ